ncbi:hypothetical protein OCH7691_03462 [Oceanibacterium hippocampi]|uniref:DUF2924 domain-containing protein n=1 Tax=Oceanibacterium hippocampi TaxID=745714 RepID=A0A1Y5TTR0_9PROT|nr:hypothetical protein OCH7691_03462 [Oceanibacterium hippocampi]
MPRKASDPCATIDSPVSRADLVAAWEQAYGTPPPKRTSERLLALSAAYHRQVGETGGLSRKTRRQLTAWADGADKETDAGKASRDTGARPGTRLVREWRGESHVVDILENGVLYKGRTFPSLSAVARAITGARWSGPRFFGL